jgi:hypothetical protein
MSNACADALFDFCKMLLILPLPINNKCCELSLDDYPRLFTQYFHSYHPQLGPDYTFAAAESTML